jgi:hypothetical protein
MERYYILSENVVLSLLQTLHNFGAVLFTAGPLYFLIVYKRAGLHKDFRVLRSIDQTFSVMPILWMSFLILQIATGSGFGLVSLVFQGLLPTVSPMAKIALTVKVVGVIVSFLIVFYIWRFLIPPLETLYREVESHDKQECHDHERIGLIHNKIFSLLSLLCLLSLMILTGAAFLRWHM